MSDAPTNGEADEGQSILLDDLVARSDFDSDLRLSIAAALGESGIDGRDRYDVFGWEDDPSEEEYAGLYLRNAYARAVVDKPATTAWRRGVDVVDRGGDTGEPTPFERDVDRLDRQHNLWSYGERVDRLAGIGEFGLLFVDFADTDDRSGLREPVEFRASPGLDAVRGFRVFPQLQVDDINYGDFGSERWGEPERFTIDLGEDFDDNVDEGTVGSITVHHSRVVQVPATQLLDDENKSRPRIEPVLNQIYDIEKTLGAVAESAYRGADYGLHINADPEKVDPSTIADDQDLRDQLDRYENGLERYLRTAGVEIDRLGGDVQDPAGIVDAELSAISAQTGIPKRILEGNAAGELSSAEQDARQWFGRVRERQRQYLAPHIVRAVIDLLLDHGILSPPAGDGFDVEWPTLFEETPEEEAAVRETRAGVIASLSQAGVVLGREDAVEFVEQGEFPDRDSPAVPEPASRDESREQFDASFFGGGDGDPETPAANQDDGPALDDPVDLRASVVSAAEAAADADENDRIPDECGTGRGVQRRDQIVEDRVTVRDLLTRDNGTPIPAYVSSHAEDFSGGAEERPVSDWTDEMWATCGNAGLARWGAQSLADIRWWQETANELAEARGETPPYDDLVANDTRFGEGDEVMTPQGAGVVVEVRTEDFEGKDGETVDASESSPTYVVGLKDGRVGVGFYSASQLRETELVVEGVDDPTGDLPALVDNVGTNGLWSVLASNQETTFDFPDSWEESDTPARVILLKAWAGLGGRFSSCVREMSGEVRNPEPFCASMKDRVLQWEGWREGD